MQVYSAPQPSPNRATPSPDRIGSHQRQGIGPRHHDRKTGNQHLFRAEPIGQIAASQLGDNGHDEQNKQAWSSGALQGVTQIPLQVQDEISAGSHQGKKTS